MLLAIFLKTGSHTLIIQAGMCVFSREFLGITSLALFTDIHSVFPPLKSGVLVFG